MEAMARLSPLARIPPGPSVKVVYRPANASSPARGRASTPRRIKPSLFRGGIGEPPSLLLTRRVHHTRNLTSLWVCPAMMGVVRSLQGREGTKGGEGHVLLLQGVPDGAGEEDREGEVRQGGRAGKGLEGPSQNTTAARGPGLRFGAPRSY